MEAKPRYLFFYESANGHAYCKEWLDAFESKRGATIVARLDRLEAGLFGDCESVGEGVSELKIDLGPGYRVYFGQLSDVVVLLNGGDESTQSADIQLAHTLWKEFKARGEQ